jgi:hypothetical protein
VLACGIVASPLEELGSYGAGLVEGCCEAIGVGHVGGVGGAGGVWGTKGAEAAVGARGAVHAYRTVALPLEELGSYYARLLGGCRGAASIGRVRGVGGAGGARGARGTKGAGVLEVPRMPKELGISEARGVSDMVRVQ